MIKKFFLVVFIFSIISLLSAIYIEYILGYNACKLCVYQRIPYIVSIFICFLGYNYFKNLIWLYLLFIIFLSSTILSGYHVGIENNLFKEYSGCLSINSEILDKNELLESLKTINPSCKEIDFTLLGFSLATINFIISILISIFIIKLIKYEKKQ